MNSEKSLSKEEILYHVIGSGINISPKALESLKKARVKSNDLEELLRKISFQQDFQSHITLNEIEPFLLKQEFPVSIGRSDLNPIKFNETKESEPKHIKKLQKLNKISNPQKAANANQSNEIRKAEILAEEINNRKSIGNDLITSTSSHETRSSPRLKEENMTSFSSFRPIAKDYSDEIEILSDPTRKIYTSGSVNDFIALMNDRFENLKTILEKNPDVKEFFSIKNLNMLHESREVGLIGMIKEKRSSGKSRHVRLIIEDPTGEISVLIRNDERNVELYSNAIYLLNDQVIYIWGYLKVDSRRKSRIIFANKIIWPDIPISSKQHVPDCPVSVALISDVHIGSKNFMPKLFDRFIRYVSCEIGSEKEREEAGKIKYIVISGDLVDGVGVYPGQERELEITDIFSQYKRAFQFIEKIPDYIKIIYSPGNHEPIRNALPHPAIPKKYCKELYDLGLIMVGNPCLLSYHGIKILSFHGDSLFDLSMSIPGLNINKPEKIMGEYLRNRHLAPIYGSKSEIAPTAKDWLVIHDVPHVLHCGHVHINGMGNYHNTLMINSGCFQSQTDFMRNLGVIPTPGFPVIVSTKEGKLNAYSINLNL